jgi:uncharacterized protein DUF4230
MPTLLEERPVARPAPEVVVRVETAPTSHRGGGRRGGRGLISTLGFGAIALAIVLVAGSLTGLINISNPFGSSTTDTSPPVLLKKLTNLSQFEAARGNFEARIETSTGVWWAPSFIDGSSVDFDGIGTVAATVDFSKLGTDAVKVNADHSVTITLPRPTLQPAVVDPKRSRVVNRSRGLTQRIGGVFTGSPTSDRELYLRAAKRMDKAARESSLVTLAERNTTKMLDGFLARLGYPTVNVEFTNGVRLTPR